MSDSKDKKGFSLGKTFAKVAKYTAFGAFSFFVLGGLDFVFFHELGVGQPIVEALKPVGETIFLGEIPGLGGSITDGVLSVVEMFNSFSPPPVSEAAAFAEAYTPLAEPSFSF